MALGSSSLGSTALGSSEPKSVTTTSDSTSPYYPPDARLNAPELFYPGRKPVGKVKIDWSHPLAKGSIGYWSFGSTDRFKDLVAGNNAFGVSDPTLGVDSISTDRNVPSYVRIEDPLAIYGDDTNGMTISTRMSIDFYEQWDKGITKKGTLGWDAEGWNIGIGNADTNYQVTYNGGHYQYTNPSSIIGIVNTLSIVSDRREDSVSLYLNGIKVATTSSAFGPPTSQPILIGAYFGQSDNDTTLTAKYLHIHNRALSDQEIKSLHNSPYQFLIPDRG